MRLGEDNITTRCVSVSSIVNAHAQRTSSQLILPNRSHTVDTKFIGSTSHSNNDKRQMEFQAKSNMAPICRKVKASEISYTLVTQASFNRVWMLKHHCMRWGLENPISVAVFVTPNDEASINASRYNGTMQNNMTMPISNDTLAAHIHDELQGAGCNGDQLTVQVVKPDISTTSNEMLSDYPVNILRNLALSAVRTTHVAYLDVDFWPSSDLHEILDNDIVRETFAQDPKTAMVIPAFSMKRQCVEQRDCVELNVPAMPLQRRQMLDAILAKKALQFDPTNAGGHGSTRYTAWINQRSTTLIPIDCVHSNRYEPYLVFRYCRDLPPFQEQFTGYGKNKMTWMMQLRRTGWSFWQLGEAFCVHYPHLSSQARRAWKQQPRRLQAAGALPMKEIPPIDRTETRRGINDAIYVDFKAWMKRSIPDETRVPNCPDFVDQDRSLWIKHRPLATTTKVDDKRGGTTNKSFVQKRLYQLYPIVSKLIQKKR
jgi:Glycosyl-transferase for dystroglycan